MAQCKLCSSTSKQISKELGVCLNCIRERPGDALPVAIQAHRRSRAAFGLPERDLRKTQRVFPVIYA